MDDSTYLGAFVYVSVVLLVAPFLPTEIYSGQFQGDADIRSSYNGSAVVTTSLEQPNLFQKIAALLFVPFLIDGIPLIFGAVITLFNYVSYVIGAIFVYDKLRGI